MFDGLIDTLQDLVYQFKITPKEFENLVLSLYSKKEHKPYLFVNPADYQNHRRLPGFFFE